MRKHRRPFYRMIALVLAVALLLPVVQVSAETIAEVEAKQEELRKENEALEEKLDALRADKAKALEYQKTLEEKIGVLEQKIDAAREAIALMDIEIVAMEQKLELSRQGYQDTIDTFSKRLTALYKTGSVGTLEILLSAHSFSDFTMKSELLSCMTKHDQELLDILQEYLEKTQDDRTKLKQMRRQEAETKKDLESSQQELQVLYQENASVIASLQASEDKAQAAIHANEEEDAALESRLQELIRLQNMAAAGNQTTGSLGFPTAPGIDGFSPWWPLPGVGMGSISGHYGEIYSDGNPHRGLDIAANYGTEIVAAESGQVLSAEYHYSWGNNVLIWHNETFTTRYAHMSVIAVSPGQYVQKGQIIGYVGSTGYSFGNHLHFEVYYDGVRVDPDPYLGI